MLSRDEQVKEVKSPSIWMRETSLFQELHQEDTVDFLDILEALSQTATTAGNRPLALDDPDAAWRVAEGQVDVFHAQPEPGLPWGSRRHLCRVEEGGAIFALDGVRHESDGTLLAVGIGPARLSKIQKADLLRLGLEPVWRRNVADMIDDWVDRISRAADSSEPVPAVALEPNATFLAEKGDVVTARGRVVWVRPAGPSLRFCGRSTIPDCPLDSRFPLSSHARLDVAAAVALESIDTETLMEDGDPWIGLKRFHRVILDAITRGALRIARCADARLESAALRDEEAVRGELADLGRIAAPEAPTLARVPGDDPLLEVCRLVGEACGAEVHAPPFGATGDPLRLIARASGLRTRRVRLTEDWWTADAGPLLAFRRIDNQPVALLYEHGRGYVMIDARHNRRRDDRRDHGENAGDGRRDILAHASARPAIVPRPRAVRLADDPSRGQGDRLARPCLRCAGLARAGGRGDRR